MLTEMQSEVKPTEKLYPILPDDPWDGAITLNIGGSDDFKDVVNYQTGICDSSMERHRPRTVKRR
jgi:hypothetical protein